MDYILSSSINWQGLLLGLVAFFTIGLFHPVVVKVEYHFGKRVWPLFLLFGLISSGISLFIYHEFWSIVLGVFGFSSFWSVFEMFKQHERVMKGRAKKNPKRSYIFFVPALILFKGLNLSGIFIGAATFLIISKARYLTIVAEYYFSKRFWIGFLVFGLAMLVLAAVFKSLELSAFFAIMGFTYLWGIGEIIEQEERVRKGWFPKNPNRDY